MGLAGARILEQLILGVSRMIRSVLLILRRNPLILHISTAKDAIARTLEHLRDKDRLHPNPQDGIVADKIGVSVANVRCLTRVSHEIIHVQEALQLVDKSHFEAVKAIGLSCSFPFGLQNAVHIISQTTDYTR